jgi:hypothetical protein
MNTKEYTITMPALPTKIGDRVRTCGYGGEVTQGMGTGTVVRFNRSGFPVIAADSNSSFIPNRLITDRFGCFRRIDADGKLIYEENTP